MAEHEGKKKRKRMASEFVVLGAMRDVSAKAPYGEPPKVYEVVATGLDDAAACQRWLRDSGRRGQEYQIAAFKGALLSVNVETVKKRTLNPSAEALPVTPEVTDG